MKHSPEHKREPAPIARLRRAAAALDALGDADAAWLAAAIREYELRAPFGDRLDELLMVAPRVGEMGWWTEESLQRRDDALRELAAITAASAPEIAKMIARYAASNWPRDLAANTMPQRYAGKEKEWLFLAFRAGDGRVPTSAKQLRRILAGTSNTAFHVPDVARISATSEENQRVEIDGP